MIGACERGGLLFVSESVGVSVSVFCGVVVLEGFCLILNDVNLSAISIQAFTGVDIGEERVSDDM